MMCVLFSFLIWFFFFKQKTAYEMRISDWSSDVCSSDLPPVWVLVMATGIEIRGADGSLRFIGSDRLPRIVGAYTFTSRPTEVQGWTFGSFGTDRKSVV